MEKRIRVIWALSLLSSMFLISVQGYWLYDQYRHVVDTCAQELSERVLEAGEKEFILRKKEFKGVLLFIEGSNTYDLMEDSSNKKRSFNITHASSEEIAENTSNGDIVEKAIKRHYDTPDSLLQVSNNQNAYLNIINISPNKSESLYYPDDNGRIGITFLKYNNVPDNVMDKGKGISLAATNFINPFREEVFDSILRADIPEINYKLLQIGRASCRERV